MATRKNKSLSHKPAGMPKVDYVYIVRDISNTILKIVLTIQLARRYSPANGSITNISLETLKAYVLEGGPLSESPIVKEFLKREAMRKK
jgi:hypothetical protein